MAFSSCNAAAQAVIAATPAKPVTRLAPSHLRKQRGATTAANALGHTGSAAAEGGGAPAAAAAAAATWRGAQQQQLELPAQHRFRPNSILPLVSSAVEASAEMAFFESVAGRSAMVGFLAAVALEGFSSQPTFGPLAPDALAALAAAAVAAVAGAGALAAAAARPAPLPGGGRAGAAGAGVAGGGGGVEEGGEAAGPPRAWWWLGARIHESVVASLTATQGSASGVTQLRVDEVVDFVVDRCLTRAVHPVFDPLYDAVDAGSTVVRVMDTLLRAGGERPDLPQ